ncbi:MAG TPA: YciI family protein [Hyphomicrobiales bacterium]|nr:YciI family protein [Hyphomicrobiales bacterium]
MPRFIFAYHGGKKPETPETGEALMAKWRNWIAETGAALTEPGNPVGKSKTVSAKGVADDGGANPLSGYSIVEVDDMNAAIKIAKACPILDGGTIEIAEIINMQSH